MQKESKENIRKFKPGDFLFRQNENTRDLFILKKGRVRIFKQEGNAEIELDTIGQGSIVGEVASIDGGPRTASGIALEEVEAVVIGESQFKRLVASVPEWFMKISFIIVQRLREVDAKINRSIEADWTNHIAAVISLLAFTDKCVPRTEGFVIDRKTVEHLIIDLFDISIPQITASLDRLNRLKYIRLEGPNIILSGREAVDEPARKVFNIECPTPIV